MSFHRRQQLRMSDAGLLQEVNGIISSGKEASVYSGVLRLHR